METVLGLLGSILTLAYAILAIIAGKDIILTNISISSFSLEGLLSGYVVLWFVKAMICIMIGPVLIPLYFIRKYR